MSPSKKRKKRPLLNTIRWIARIFSGFYILMVIIFLIADILDNGMVQFSELDTREVYGFVFGALYLGGLILAFFKEGPGGFLSILATIGFAVALKDPVSSLHILMFVPGILYITFCILMRRSLKKEEIRRKERNAKRKGKKR